MNKLTFIIYIFSFITNIFIFAQDYIEVPQDKPLLILFDYDGTLAALAPGQQANTHAGKRILNFNEELIQLGALAQENGAICIGFTNWFSMNYAHNGGISYDNSPGRSRITKACGDRGLRLDQVVLTHSFLYAFEKLSTHANEKDLSIKDYINTLSLDERLAILGSYYSDIIAKAENENSYDNGIIGNKSKHVEIFDIIKTEEARLNNYLEEAKKYDLGNPCTLLEVKELAPGEKGMDKFQMFDIVLLLLPEFKIIVFDDKKEVYETSNKIKEIFKKDIIAKHVLFNSEGKTFDDNISQWYDGLDIDRQNCLQRVAIYKDNENKLDSLTESQIKNLTFLKEKFTGRFYNTEIEKNIKNAIEQYVLALASINTQRGTSSCKYMIDATNSLLKIIDINKTFVLNKCKWSDAAYEKFKQDCKSCVLEQITKNPIHRLLSDNQKNKFRTSLGLIIENPIMSIVNNNIPLNSVESLLKIIGDNINLFKDIKDQEVFNNIVKEFDLSKFSNSNSWSDEQKKIISLLNKATLILQSNINIDVINSINSIYRHLMTLEGCTEGFKMAFKSKCNILNNLLSK